MTPEEQTFTWLESILAEINNGVSELWDTIDEVMEAFKRLKAQQPYHINVIDELHVNENANSRILAKLFQFQNEAGQYEILESFVRYMHRVSHSDAFHNIHVENPNITKEEERIDIWVRDKNFALILENKIYDAGDQEAQLARYIEKTLAHGYTTEQIFVIYMPSSACEPSEQTWILTDDKGKEHNYAAEFQERYLNLSFREYILPWLKNDIVPNVRHKDFYLLNALNQYVDYLEGMFYLREIDKKLNMEIQELISQKLELDNKKSLEEKYQTVRNKINDINNIIAQLELLSDSICRQKINAIVDKYQFVQEEEPWYPSWITSIDGVEYKLLLGKEGAKFYCQFNRQDLQTIQGTELQKELHKNLPQTSADQQFGIWKYVSDYYEVLVLFEKVIEVLLPKVDK